MRYLEVDKVQFNDERPISIYFFLLHGTSFAHLCEQSGRFLGYLEKLSSRKPGNVAHLSGISTASPQGDPGIWSLHGFSYKAISISTQASDISSIGRHDPVKASPSS
jgi:hypothetical protein